MLQYCSSDDYQTMITELEEERTKKVGELESEIEQKQEVIDFNEELNRQKNSKIFKEIKTLQEMNSHLILEKELLKNDCKEY